MKTIFFGSSKFVIPLIKTLVQNTNLALVITTEKLKTEAVPAYCLKNHIPFLSVSDVRNEQIVSDIKKINAQIAVLAYFGILLPKSFLELFPKGIVNIHPSLLPLYRGPTPGQATLINGDTTTGTTLIKLDEKMDHGPILVQEKITIDPKDTSDTLYEKLFLLGAKLLSENIEKYHEGHLATREQDHAKATYTKILSRESGCIDLSSPLEKEVFDRMVRAYYPWPGVWTRWNGRIIKFFPDNKVQIEGKKIVDYKTFLSGYPKAKPLLDQLISVEPE